MPPGSLGSSASIGVVGHVWKAGGWEIKNPFDWKLGELISGNSLTLQGQQSSSTRAEVPLKAQNRGSGLPPTPTPILPSTPGFSRRNRGQQEKEIDVGKSFKKIPSSSCTH